MSARIDVRVLKYDGKEYRRWNAFLARQEGSLIVLDAEFEVEVEHETLGRILRGTRTLEYYWLGGWYNVFKFLSHDGLLRLYYCNINMPPQLENGVLTYVDLDIDVLVQPDLSYQILDLEEFDTNAERYHYPDQVKAQARSSLAELIGMIEKRAFPFTG
ncbi:MAG TPA: DUF402 domain-containing protein [Pyrinomonadaceae bacterium]|nr:DUF402 domain-containing protein [Pyrinomonadaceae bacterium]